MKQFELTFEGMLDDSADALRRIKSILVGELNLEVPTVQEILVAPPRVIMTSWDETQLKTYCERLEMAGALVHLSGESEVRDEAIAEEMEEEFELSFELEELVPEPRSEPKVWSLDLEDHIEEEVASDSTESLGFDPEDDFAPSLQGIDEVKNWSLELEETEGEVLPIQKMGEDLPASLELEPSNSPTLWSLTLEDEKSEELIEEDLSGSLLSLHSGEQENPLLLLPDQEDILQQASQENPPSLVVEDVIEVERASLEETPPVPVLELVAPKEEAPQETQAVVPTLAVEPVLEVPEVIVSQEETTQVASSPTKPSRFVSLAIEMTRDETLEEEEEEEREKKKVPLAALIGATTALLIAANYFYFVSSPTGPDPLRGLTYEDLLRPVKSTAARESKAAPSTPVPEREASHRFGGEVEKENYKLSLNCEGTETLIQSCSAVLTTAKPREPLPEEIVQGISRAPWAERVETSLVRLTSTTAGSIEGEAPIRAYVDYKGERERIVGRVRMKIRDGKIRDGETPVVTVLMTNSLLEEAEAPQVPQLEYAQGAFQFRFAQNVELSGKGEIRKPEPISN